MLAYLFEKFPSFSQTFCAREVNALRRRGLEFPIYSLHRPTGEPAQDELSTEPAHYLPVKFDTLLADDAEFRRAARKALEDLKKLWGSEKEKRRIYEALWLRRRFQAEGIHHVHVHFAGAAARTAFWLNRLFGIHYSITAHANDIFRDESPERLAQIFDAAVAVVTVSDFSVRFLQKQYPVSRKKFSRVYNGIETDRFVPAKFPPGPPLMVAVGRYIEKKGFGDLLEACFILRELDFQCQIVGHGPLEQSLRDHIVRRGLQGRVTITGPKTESEISALLSGARLFVLPCLNASDGAVDNLPTVIMEAMAAALPVVSTAVAGIPEMVEDGKTGFVVPEKSPTALAERLAVLLDDLPLAHAMGLAGRDRCKRLFDSNHTSGCLADVFKSHGT